MPKLSTETWLEIRTEREAGASLPFLSAKYNISAPAINQREKREGWCVELELDDQIRRRTSEKFMGLDQYASAPTRVETVDRIAEKNAAILRNHQEEPDSARERVLAGIAAHKQAITDGMDLQEIKLRKQIAFEDLKAAKIAAEALSIIQGMERKAFSLDVETKQEVVISNPRTQMKSKT